MCYSALVWQNYRDYVRMFGARIDIREFVRLYVDRANGAAIKTTKAMDASFANPATDDEQQIKALIDDWNSAQRTKLEQEMFSQKQRLSTAERTLETKPDLKSALESKRIAADKISRARARLADLSRDNLVPMDSRIYPQSYLPVMVSEAGERVIKPMRYLCRLPNAPALMDKKLQGNYNSRFDNLKNFWRPLFGVTHGVVVVTRFYENVSQHRLEKRELAQGEQERNVVLEFRPEPEQTMLIACLWSHWKGRAGEPDLLSCSMITNDPLPEVAAAGHDRTIIDIKPENLDRWLNPDREDSDAQIAILLDRQPPYYAHNLEQAA